MSEMKRLYYKVSRTIEFSEGWDARVKRKSMAENPYKIPARKERWDLGWEAAELHLRIPKL